MPTGYVRRFDPDRKFGFIVPEDSDRGLYVHADDVTGTLSPGDVVTYEMQEGEQRRRAVEVKVERAAPEGSRPGRIMHQPPTWDILEDRDRQARAQRRRRR